MGASCWRWRLEVGAGCYVRYVPEGVLWAKKVLMGTRVVIRVRVINGHHFQPMGKISDVLNELFHLSSFVFFFCRCQEVASHPPAPAKLRRLQGNKHLDHWLSYRVIGNCPASPSKNCSNKRIQNRFRLFQILHKT